MWPGVQDVMTSPVALMAAAGLPRGPAPPLPLDIDLGSAQDTSSQELAFAPCLPTQVAQDLINALSVIFGVGKSIESLARIRF